MKRHKGFMAIKIDLEKAYDRVNWDFLSSTLSLAGIPLRLKQIIMDCVLTPSMQTEDLGKYLRIPIVHGRVQRTLFHNMLDRWVPGSGLLADYVVISLSDEEVQVPIHSYVTESTRWDWEQIAPRLNNSSLLRIASVVAPASGAYGDKVSFWRLAPSGNYTVASAYKLLTEGSGTDYFSKLWKNIWRWEGPQRIRSLCDTLSCPHCESGAESTLHVLRDCALAKQVWSRFVPIDAQPDFFTMDLLDWLWQNLSYPHHQHWSTTFATSCRLLWTWRNKELSELDFSRPTSACRTILQIAQSFREGWALVEKVIGTTSKRWVDISWIQLLEDFFKLNTDGYSRGNPGAAGAGGLIRDVDGSWIVRFAQNVGIAMVAVAELWGGGLFEVGFLTFVVKIGRSRCNTHIGRVTLVRTSSQIWLWSTRSTCILFTQFLMGCFNYC
ncbi:hypothetical protein CRG98_033774 [Punica granatum]|uniref:Reverse transcriptase zinc-binding domain-containing protein n=1 Tax=Punica granatum TaxID=22663 RepID=A0A2I0IP79_PUNGR|nr:hypothetical protein CRG98_033774 [Punica granatum]